MAPARPLIVGLCGPAGAGKSTAGRIIVKAYGARVAPLAAPLKRMLLTLGIPKRHLYGTTAEKAAPLELLGGQSGRAAMQTLGTEWGRNYFGDDFWVRAWSQTVDRIEGVRVIVVDDVRFPNEATAIRARGGVIIKIVGRNAATQDGHASENHEAIEEDVTIVNSGSRQSLKEAVCNVVGRKLGHRALTRRGARKAA